MIRLLRRRYGDTRFRIFTHTHQIRGQDLCDLYASASVVVGDSLALPGHRDYWSDRFYETTGRGGALLGPYVPGIERHLTPGEHFVPYDIGDIDSVFMRVEWMLDNPDKRAAIAEYGNEHTRAHHTYRHRVQEMLDVLELA